MKNTAQSNRDLHGVPAGTKLADLYPDGILVDGGGNVLTEPDNRHTVISVPKNQRLERSKDGIEWETIPATLDARKTYSITYTNLGISKPTLWERIKEWWKR